MSSHTELSEDSHPPPARSDASVNDAPDAPSRQWLLWTLPPLIVLAAAWALAQTWLPEGWFGRSFDIIRVYPGHRPCPVPVSRQFPTQWEASGKYVLSNRRAWDAPLAGILATRPFPVMLDRRYLQFVRLRRALGGDHGYAIDAARALNDVWVRSGGRFDWR